jgi:hypothetical protein
MAKAIAFDARMKTAPVFFNRQSIAFFWRCVDLDQAGYLS